MRVFVLSLKGTPGPDGKDGEPGPPGARVTFFLNFFCVRLKLILENVHSQRFLLTCLSSLQSQILLTIRTIGTSCLPAKVDSIKLHFRLNAIHVYFEI